VKKKLGTITYHGEKLVVRADRHYSNGRVAVEVFGADGEPFAVLSVNLPNVEAPKKDHFYVKTWSENEILRAPALASGLFEDTGERIPTGWVEAEVWKVKAA
jgi:hypothetical protein